MATSTEERWHEEWLGLVQPVDGLVVSIPVLVEAQCLSRQSPETQRHLATLCAPAASGALAIVDLPAFLADVLGWTPDTFLTGDALPEDLRLYVPEGQQIIKPTLALKAAGASAGAAPVALLWDLGLDAADLSFDKPETRTGSWEYPAAAKFDRLLRHTRVPIGVLTNRSQLRLIYAPHGESSGSITFKVADLVEVGGRPILDALVMLLGRTRFHGVAPEHQLPAILAESRKRQANVTNELADQVFEALELLLRGFEAAAERDGRAVLDAAYAQAGDHLYGGLLTQLLRLVFVLYAEDRDLLPVQSELYAQHYSLLGLHDELARDHGAYPDSMARRFGAYGRLVALFRAIYLGVEHGDLHMPARRGALFSPHEYPFLEGWAGEPGNAPIVDPGARADTRVPSVDDETVYRVLDKLLVLKRQRLSYRALDVEQIGSVYEALMGYHVLRLAGEAVCLKPSRVWVSADEIQAEKPATRARWLQETTGLSKGQADKLNKALAGAKGDDAVLAVLDEHAVSGQARRGAGQLVIQPGPERRRTSSHYTPRSLTAPIVHKTLAPLLRAMGEAPPSERILNLKVCDPAMGSGAFLVEACRYLADQVVLAWTREGRHDLLAGAEDATLVARRLVAQRCLYGVDKNAYAVNLAKLSIWLVTLAKELPFTFVDHALRHGDSLVGLSFEQITAFHWKPSAQLELCQTELAATLNEAIVSRQRILELAGDPSREAQAEKEWLLKDAEDALDRVRIIGDLVVGAFFSSEKDKEREAERVRRLDLVLEWLRGGGVPGGELVELRTELRKTLPVFHWMAEYPEVFWVDRPDPLDGDRTGQRAWIDAFVGNPPFAGKNGIADMGGASLVDWLKVIHEGAHGNADYSAHFFRRADVLLGDHGTIGLLATNTIAQGDTRATGLQWLLRAGAVIYDATRSMPWPGEAAVSVSRCSPGEGTLGQSFPAAGESRWRRSAGSILDFAQAASVQTPSPLRANHGLSYHWGNVLGMGFILTPDQRSELVVKDPRNARADLPLPRWRGDQHQPDPGLRPFRDQLRRDVSGGSRRLADLLEIVRQKVKPESDVQQPRGRRLPKVLVAVRQRRGRTQQCTRAGGTLSCDSPSLSKHLVFCFPAMTACSSQKLFVFVLDDQLLRHASVAPLHIAWAASSPRR